MTGSNDIEYYMSRERRERELAENATNPAVSAIHAQLAARYSELLAMIPLQIPVR